MASPPPPHPLYLQTDQIYSCLQCHAHLAKNDDIISKGFQGRHGRAYLFKQVYNITLGPKEDRVLMTGLHSVADIACTICKSTVGWIYIYAFEESQKYKEGKFIVEKAKIVKESPWIRNTL
ncbi:Protein yippee-like 4 [Actinomortierella ambigua]|nr:Protein yippee-like 4 [Actinomortierella ambigua]